MDVNFIVMLRRSFFEEVLLSLRQIRILYGSDHDEIFLHEGPGMKGGGSGLMILFTAWRLVDVKLIDIPNIFEVSRVPVNPKCISWEPIICFPD